MGRKSVREEAHLPVARTEWSTAPSQLKQWRRCHEVLVQEAQGYAPGARGARLVLIGDSITESWRGTSICRPIGRCRGVPDVLRETLASQWPSPAVLGIAADHTQHVLWRMMHGELTSAMRNDPMLISVLLIGTNNLGRGHSAAETVAGIDAVVDLLLKQTKGMVLVNALFPRGDAAKRKYADTVIGTAANGRPIRSFAPLIGNVNAALNASIAARRELYARRVTFIDCSEPFKLGQGVRTDLMPDTLHPNAQGYRLWADCLTPALRSLEGRLLART
ncbi:hypothetical protein AB1Y20_006171 [Prymnesium parvum]|uniref:SGNH hydrolase-type esterase domain-containing protein n=1 Tax=Prymnesium parvum TaxID=97485 RepID=A0AB34J1Y9_PRYPA